MAAVYGNCPVCGIRRMLTADGRIRPDHKPCLGAGQVPGPDLPLVEYRRLTRLSQLVAHLNRCVHSVFRGDMCLRCPNQVSVGNLLLPPNTHIGTNSIEQAIVVPDVMGPFKDPLAWYRDPDEM